MFIAFDSLKFYKLKNENVARVLFLILYVIILLSYLFPVGETLTQQFLSDAIRDNPQTWVNQLRVGHFVNMAFIIGVSMVTSYVSILYANCQIMETEGFPARKAIIASIRRLPHLIGFLMFLILPVILSGIFLFIPLIFIYYMLFFTPLLVTEGRMGLFQAIQESYKATKGFRFNLFTTQLLLYLIVSIPINLFSVVFISSGNQNTLSEFLVMAFIRAAQVLITGRMMGNYYLLLVKHQGIMKNIRFDLMNLHRAPDEKNQDANSDDDEENESNSSEK